MQAEASVDQAKSFEQGSKSYVRPSIEILCAEEITQASTGFGADGMTSS